MGKGMSVLRWGIIGCGDVATHKGGPPLYTVEGSALIAVMRRNGERAREFAERHGAKRYYDTVEALLADEEINAVYIATPPSLHCEQTVLAAQAGKHVLCEKPMAMNVAECRRMLDACRQNSVALMIAYYRSFYPNVVKMRQLMDEGAIGKIVLAKVNHTAFYKPTRHEWGAWRTDPEVSGGGVLMDLGSHRIDLLMHLVGEVVSVCGHADTVQFPYPVDDSAVFTLKFAGGAHGVANINWSVGVSMDEVAVYGTEGILRYSPLNSGNLTLQTRERIQELHQAPLPYTHTGLVEDFVNHLRTGAPIRVSGENGLRTNEIIAEIYGRNAA